MNKTNEKKHVFETIRKTLSILLTVVLVFIATIIVSQRFFDKAFLGCRMYIVATGSMKSVYEIGDVVFAVERDTDKIKVGDDVVYYGTQGSVKDKTITHRVIDIEEVDGERMFHTKGVANDTEDPVVSKDQIKGVVITKLRIVTFICSLGQNKYTIYFCLILPLTLFVFFKIIHVKAGEDD